MIRGTIERADTQLSFGKITLGAAGTNPFDNVIDFGQTDADGLCAAVSVTTTAVGGTNVALKLQGSADNSAFSDILTMAPVTLAELKKGAAFSVPIPRGFSFRYLRLAAVTTGTFTGGVLEGNLDAWGAK